MWTWQCEKNLLPIKYFLLELTKTNQRFVKTTVNVLLLVVEMAALLKFSKNSHLKTKYGFNIFMTTCYKYIIMELLVGLFWIN